MKKGQIEAAITAAVTHFERETLGRGPREARTFLVHDLVVVRLKGILSPGEQQVAREPGGTRDFADAVIARLGQEPRHLAPVHYRAGGIHVLPARAARTNKELAGVDVFLDWNDGGRNPDILGAMLDNAAPAGWRLRMITNRGVKVYPDGLPETFCTDHWRCRFVPQADGPIAFDQVLALLGALHTAGLDVIKTEHLYTFDGQRGYSLGQGE